MTDLPRFEAPRIVSGTYAGQTLDVAFDAAMDRIAQALEQFINDQLVPMMLNSRTGPLLLSPERAAERLDCGRTTIYALIDAGDLASVKVGRLRRIPAAALKDYVDRLQREAGAAE